LNTIGYARQKGKPNPVHSPFRMLNEAPTYYPLGIEDQNITPNPQNFLVSYLPKAIA
jgi:hypothetical protein